MTSFLSRYVLRSSASAGGTATPAEMRFALGAGSATMARLPDARRGGAFAGVFADAAGRFARVALAFFFFAAGFFLVAMPQCTVTLSPLSPSSM